MLFTATRFPHDYGFVKNTLSNDGDPLDALIMLDEPTFPGCVVSCRVIGMFRMTDEKGGDDKLSERIQLPVSYTTSCAFAGKDLNQLVITTAHNNEMAKHPQAGMTFICNPGIKGKKTKMFEG